MTESQAETTESTTSNTGDAKESKPTEKTFTQAELDQIINDRLERERKSYEKKEAERKKAEEIEKLSGEEKLNAKHKAELDKILAERDEAIKSVRLSDAGKKLAELGYTSDFASMMLGADDSETTANIEKFDRMVKELVTKQVQGNLAHGSPSVPNGGEPKNTLKDIVRRSAGLR